MQCFVNHMKMNNTSKIEGLGVLSRMLRGRDLISQRQLRII